MLITYEQYDHAEDKCEQIFNAYKDGDNDIATDIIDKWPRLSELQSIDFKKHFEDFFNYLMFWDTQDLTPLLKDEPETLSEYKKSKKFIRNLMINNVELVEEIAKA